MNVTALLIAILILFLVGYGAYIIANKFMPEGLRVPVLAIVGVILLITIIGFVTGEVSIGGLALR